MGTSCLLRLLIGPFWALLGPVYAQLGLVLAHLGPVLALFGPVLGLFSARMAATVGCPGRGTHRFEVVLDPPKWNPKRLFFDVFRGLVLTLLGSSLKIDVDVFWDPFLESNFHSFLHVLAP